MEVRQDRIISTMLKKQEIMNEEFNAQPIYKETVEPETHYEDTITVIPSINNYTSTLGLMITTKFYVSSTNISSVRLLNCKAYTINTKYKSGEDLILKYEKLSKLDDDFFILLANIEMG